ncbi:probable protein phosphatase 2C 52, partial [Arachis hypogaea]|uniref:probable protein phosphatase 2C 52 n=1 Tax=Arachis hypogaea TaxID=3818 RepID=UPI003B2233AE
REPRFLLLSASSEKLVVGLLRSPISRAFLAVVVTSGSSRNFPTWTSSPLRVLSLPRSQSRAPSLRPSTPTQKQQVPDFLLAFSNSSASFAQPGPNLVWDMLSNEEVVEIVSTTPTRASAARVLVDSAAREWKLKYPTSKMDDCAVVCLFLDGKMDVESDCDEQCYSSATIQSNHSGNPVESDDGQMAEPSLHRNFTV